MLIKRPQFRNRVSNRVALVAALILTLSTYLGLADNTSFEQNFENKSTVAEVQADDPAATKSHRKQKLSISLLLFGRG